VELKVTGMYPTLGQRILKYIEENGGILGSDGFIKWEKEMKCPIPECPGTLSESSGWRFCSVESNRHQFHASFVDRININSVPPPKRKTAKECITTHRTSNYYGTYTDITYLSNDFVDVLKREIYGEIAKVLDDSPYTGESWASKMHGIASKLRNLVR